MAKLVAPDTLIRTFKRDGHFDIVRNEFWEMVADHKTIHALRKRIDREAYTVAKHARFEKMTAELIASENTKQVMLDMTRQRIIESPEMKDFLNLINKLDEDRESEFSINIIKAINQRLTKI